MRQMPANSKADTRDDTLHGPSKADFVSVLTAESSRAGLQLEWMLDRCDEREGDASWER